MILLGYTVCIFYIAILIILTKLAFKLTKITEVGRKLLHIGTFGILFIARAFFVSFFHLAIICALSAVFTFVTTKFHLIKSIERKKHSIGEFYYSLSLLACAICICFFPNLYDCLVVAFASLSIGDGLASIFGAIPPKIKLYQDKTVLGTLACIVFTFLALLILKLTGFIALDYLVIISLSISAGIFELIGNGLDNISVPLSAFILCTLSIYFGEPLSIAMLIAEGVFIIAFLSKFITYYGSLLAGLIGFCFYYFGGLFAFIYLLGCYAVMLLTLYIRKIVRTRRNEVKRKSRVKNFLQIFVNGFTATIIIILYGIFNRSVLFIMALVTVSSSFVDSLSSDIGTLSKGQAYDIITRKPVESGISGGVSLLGTLSSLFGTIMFATAITFITQSPIYFIAILTAIIFTGTITDSILGSTLQARYHCPVCGAVTEKRVCCENPTVKEKGVTFMNNNTVNFLSPLVPCALCFLLFLI